MRVACIIPTYNGKSELIRLLDSLENQTQKFDTFFIDSTSNDGTLELLIIRNQNTILIPSSEFNHGGSRQKIVNLNPNYDIYIFLNRDNYH
jgi:rhamnosyltransferase